MEFRTVKVSSIKVDRGDRFREDMGDLSGMVETIKSGLYIQPISVDDDFVLIAGERRLQAHKQAGLKEILVRVWPGLTKKQKLELQHIENEQRKELLPSEKAKAYKKLQEEEPAVQGKRTDLKAYREDDSTCGQMPTSSKTRTKEEKRRDRLAKKAGFESTDEARRTEKVFDNSPPELMSAVDAQIVSVSDAAAIADEPVEKQLEALERVKDGTAKTLKAGLKKPSAMAESKADIRAARAAKPSSEDSEPVLDCYGRVVPGKMMQVLSDTKAVSAVVSYLTELKKLITEMMHDPTRGAYIPMGTDRKIEELRSTLWSARFHSVCVYCEANPLTECRACRGAGWITVTTADSAPREKKQKRA